MTGVLEFFLGIAMAKLIAGLTFFFLKGYTDSDKSRPQTSAVPGPGQNWPIPLPLHVNPCLLGKIAIFEQIMQFRKF